MKDAPKLVSQFRPISLYNVLMKVITKVIANHLKPLMTNPTGDTQCSFTPRWQAAENIILSQEVVHSIKKKKGNWGIMAVKIDLEKADDGIEFLEKVLHHIRFSPHLV